MLIASRRRAILSLSLPIIGGMASQNVFNLVDAAMVGRLGDEALAAVGFASFLNFLFSAFVLGLSAGVQATTARRVGQGKVAGGVAALNGGLLLAVVLAVPWSLLLVATAPFYMHLLLDTPVLVELGVPYLQLRLLSMVAMGANFAFRGYWNAVSRPGLYMRTLVVMHIANIALNYVFIFGAGPIPAYGVAGAGAASALATVIGTLNYLYLGHIHARGLNYLRSVDGWPTLMSLLRLSAPAGGQQLFFAGGMTAFVWIASRLGTQAIAATHVLTSLLLVGVLPGIGCGLAAATLVGRSLGQGNRAEAQRWGWEVVIFAVGVVTLISLPAVIAPDFVLRGFIAEADTRAMASFPLRLVAIFMPLDTIGLVLMNAMIGAGDTRRTFVTSVLLQWGLFLPAAWIVGPVLGGGLSALWAANVAYRQLQAVAFAIMWQRVKWADRSI